MVLIASRRRFSQGNPGDPHSGRPRSPQRSTGAAGSSTIAAREGDAGDGARSRAGDVCFLGHWRRIVGIRILGFFEFLGVLGYEELLVQLGQLQLESNFELKTMVDFPEISGHFHSLSDCSAISFLTPRHPGLGPCEFQVTGFNGWSPTWKHPRTWMKPNSKRSRSSCTSSAMSTWAPWVGCPKQTRQRQRPGWQLLFEISWDFHVLLGIEQDQQVPKIGMTGKHGEDLSFHLHS